MNTNRRDQQVDMRSEDRKHLPILNGIALMLVTESKGDVAAVTFLKTTDSIEVHYAKILQAKGSYLNISTV